MDTSSAAVRKAYAEFQAQGLSLNMTRGNPSPEQLNLSSGLFHAVDEQNCHSREGLDTRNYGGLSGLLEARELIAFMLDVPVELTRVIGASTLTNLYDTEVRLLLSTAPGGSEPWSAKPVRKILCPAPGYDRHFHMTAGLGFELITVPMGDDGPDMDLVEKLVREDPGILEIWCVPKYSNPTGVTYSAEVCRRLASMETAAPDFRILWDNAYVIHHLDMDQPDTLPDMYQLCVDAGHADRILMYASTSKVTFAGGGIAGLAMSPANLAWFEGQQKLQMICTDKVNQLRHARLFPNKEALLAHMRALSDLIRPKFEAFEKVFAERLSDLPEVRWSHPHGGYFIGLWLPSGTARRVVALAADAGLKLTPAGHTYPYDVDPEDHFLRIAPTFPPLGEAEQAAELLAVCIRLAVLEKAGA